MLPRNRLPEASSAATSRWGASLSLARGIDFASGMRAL
jgi:hypothetical protein